MIQDILKNKKKKCVRLHEIILLIIMKMEMKMKDTTYRHDENRPRYRHGQKYSKYKKCLSMMILICNKEELFNI